MEEMKQMLVIRKDLKMSAGKSGAQCGHGATKGFFDRGTFVETPGLETPYELRIPCTRQMYEWVNGIFTKVCVAAASEEELLEIKAKAEAAGIMTALIEDCGLTCFNGEKTLTVLALGPDSPERLDPITGNLPLYR